MKKKLFALALILLWIPVLVLPAQAAGSTGTSGGGLESGSLSMTKLSKEEIVQLLEDNPLTMPDEVFEAEPSCSAPYAIGTVKTSVLQAATDRLNALRQIAGLPGVTLDLSLCENAQYGAVISASYGTLNHYPAQPADMDDSFYQQALAATSSSNLSAGRTLLSAVDGLMSDSSASNISTVGHRRWQLNPQLGKVGFGYATSNTLYRTYVAEKVFDRSGAAVDYDFIAWPASGNFPNHLSAFAQDTPWSVTLNPNEYQTPNQSSITVTLTRERDGKSWTFSGNDSTAANSGLYFHVDTDGYGVSNCIIFRPDGIDQYEGVYTVQIDGLKTKSGQSVSDFTYQVDFFDASNYSQPPAGAVSDTPAGTAHATSYSILVDGRAVDFDAYALRDENGNDTNYLKLRDVAYVLNGSAAQFDVGWDGSITITTGTAYASPNGSEMSTPFSGDQSYTENASAVLINGVPTDLSAITLTDANGGAYTYFKLRDLGQALGFAVDWDSAAGAIVIDTSKP